jgi:uncharacterized protein (DUF2267 family)
MASTNRSVEDMRAMLFGNEKAAAEPPKSVATLHKKDGTIDVTEEVLKVLTEPLIDKATTELRPVLEDVIDKATTQRANETETKLQEAVNRVAAEMTKSYNDTGTKLSNEVAEAIKDLTKLAHQVRPIEVRTEKQTYQITGVQHSKFENLLKIVGANLPVFMVGPAGTGKTAGAERAASALGLDFYAMSVGSQTSKSDIFGYKDAQGNYHGTAFRDAYENGGVFLLDEADAGNANVLVGLNAALSNGYVFFPDAKVKMHDNFRMVATANTFGTGASRQYVGRNQLDAATLDRFTVLTWDIDMHIEEALATGAYGSRWLRVVREVRAKAIDELELRVVVSPRSTMRGSMLLDAGMSFEDTLEVALIANMPEAERALLRQTAQAAWDRTAPENKPKRKTATTKKPTVDLDELKAELEDANTPF